MELDQLGQASCSISKYLSTLSIPIWKRETFLTTRDIVAVLGAVIGGEKALMTAKAHSAPAQSYHHQSGTNDVVFMIKTPQSELIHVGETMKAPRTAQAASHPETKV